MSDAEKKQITLATVLSECHATCGRIEDVLGAVTTAPPRDTQPETTAQPEPAVETITQQLDADLRNLRSLAGRLDRLEVHAHAVRRELAEVA